MNEQEQYELIERYLDGSLGPEDRAEVERRMASEEEFREAVALHRHLREALTDEGAVRLSNALAQVDAKRFGGGEAPPEQRPAGRTRRLRPRWYAAAAAVLLLAVTGWFVLRGPGGESPLALYEEYFSVYDAPGNVRAATPDLEAGLKRGFNAYNARNYNAALIAFEVIEAKDSTQLTARFYYAMSAMASGSHDNAIPRLRFLAERPGHPYRNQARWYLALAHLHNMNTDEARPLLELLAKGESNYAMQAREILDAL